MEGPNEAKDLMRQLALELNGYPRPIAWTLSEVDRAKGDRDHHNMLLTALEEITRYLLIIQLARYSEYWAQDRGSAEVERRLADLRLPSFGHYVATLAALDEYLCRAEDPYAIAAAARRRSPAMQRIFADAGTRAKKISVLGFLGKIVELRNQSKGHGYTDQTGARVTTAHLQPALTELLNEMPLLVARPLVWIEQIEYIDQGRWVVTFLELMGTQRARRRTRDVQDPGNLKKGFLYMWDGESSPLQLTPFLHLDQAPHDERVYVLAGVSGEPVYQARGSSEARRRPDQLLSQLEERAPFLLKSARAVTTPRPPDAARFYRHAVEVALADGEVSRAEESRLEAMRMDLGLAEGEAAVIHAELGWNGELAESTPVPPVAPRDERTVQATPARQAAGWQKSVHGMLAAVHAEVTPRLTDVARAIELDEDADADSELWISLGRSQVVSVWISSKRGRHVRVALGFYSTHESRDPKYRKVRRLLESTHAPTLAAGWRTPARKSKAATLALETFKRFAIAELDNTATVREVSGATTAFATAAGRAMLAVGGEAPNPAPLESSDAPVSASVPEDFALDELEGRPRLEGSVWKARILWALEWARRNDPGPKSAADIANILTEHGVRVPGTNTARAFRTPKDDPRATELVEMTDGQKYVITRRGRRALFELLAVADASSYTG